MDEQYERFIVRYFLGELNDMEKTALDRWLQESEENRIYFNAVKKAREAISTFERMRTIDENKAFQKVSGILFGKRRSSMFIFIQKIAAALFLPLLVASVWFYLVQEKKSEIMSSVYQQAESQTGMRSSLVLPDGSKVWLNSDSRIRYPVYPGSSREVYIEGEVYFEVEKDPERPFKVHAGDLNIEVTGTKFNCQAYPEDRVITTVLVEGSVEIGSRDGSGPMVMKPGELVGFSKPDGKMTRSLTDPEKHIAWKSGKLIFRDDPMDMVIAKLERWYNIDIQIVDKSIEQYSYTATFENETLDQVLRFLELSAPISYSVADREQYPDGRLGKQKVKIYSQGEQPVHH
ncbi:MAG: FecR domain-containing protein [Prolixibacteraceae bacterium]